MSYVRVLKVGDGWSVWAGTTYDCELVPVWHGRKWSQAMRFADRYHRNSDLTGTWGQDDQSGDPS